MNKYCIVLLLILSFLFCACGRSSAVSAAGNDQLTEDADRSVTVTDQTGRTVTIEGEPQKIVSGYYISTSILIALGLKDKLKGIESKAEKRPIYRLSAPELISLPDVGSAKQFDFEKCASLDPDLVILPAKLQDSAQTLESLGIKVIFIDPEDENKLTEAIRLIGKTTFQEDRAAELIDSISAVSKELAEKTSTLEKPKVCITGNSNLLSVASGNMYQSYLIETAGGKNAADELTDKTWAEISYEQLLKWDPDYIIIAGEAGYSADDILNDTNLSECTAVKNRNVYQIPSSAESLDSPVPAGIYGSFWLASLLHPETVSDTDFINSISSFYKKFYGFEFSKE